MEEEEEKEEEEEEGEGGGGEGGGKGGGEGGGGEGEGEEGEEEEEEEEEGGGGGGEGGGEEDEDEDEEEEEEEKEEEDQCNLRRSLLYVLHFFPFFKRSVQNDCVTLMSFYLCPLFVCPFACPPSVAVVSREKYLTRLRFNVSCTLGAAFAVLPSAFIIRHSNMARQPPVDQRPPYCRGFTITPRHTTLGRTAL